MDESLIILTDAPLPKDTRPRDVACPQCGRGPEHRVASSGFGVPHPVCICGHEWPDEEFRR